MMIHNIPFPLRLKLENLLEPDEKVEWSQTPLLKRVLRRKNPIALFGIFFLGFAIFISSNITDGPSAFKIFFGIMLVPFFIVNTVMILIPVYARLVNRKNIYAITNKRALSLTKTPLGYQTISRHFNEMNHIDKEINKKGEGDIWFYKTFFVDKNNKKHYRYEGFIGVENAREIHKLLLLKIKEARDKVEIGSDLSVGFKRTNTDYLPEYLKTKLESVLMNGEKMEVQFQPVMNYVLRRALPGIISGIFMLVFSYFWMSYVMKVNFSTLTIHLLLPALICLTALLLMIPPIIRIYGYAKGLYVITDKRIILLLKSFTGCKMLFYYFKDITNIHAIRDNKHGYGDLSFRILLRNQSNNRDNFTNIYLLGITNVKKIEKFIKQKTKGTQTADLNT